MRIEWEVPKVELILGIRGNMTQSMRMMSCVIYRRYDIAMF